MIDCYIKLPINLTICFMGAHARTGTSALWMFLNDKILQNKVFIPRLSGHNNKIHGNLCCDPKHLRRA